MIKYKRSILSNIFDSWNYMFMVFLMIIMAYPFWYITVVSISDFEAVAIGQVNLLPIGIQFESYKMLLSANDIPLAFLNSTIYTVVGTALALFVSTMTAYAISRDRLKFKKYIMLFFVITMFVPGGMIPNFLLIRSLGLYNTLWALVLPGAFQCWNIIIIRTNIKASVHTEITDAAFIDGAGHVRIYVQIVLPLIKPIMATIGLFVAVGRWNDFFGPLLYLSDSSKFPLQIILRKMLISGDMGTLYEKVAGNAGETRQGVGFFETAKMAAIVVSVWPILAVYPFIQKYFVKGIMVGSLKG